jgi:hypothetical protein
MPAEGQFASGRKVALEERQHDAFRAAWQDHPGRSYMPHHDYKLALTPQANDFGYMPRTSLHMRLTLELVVVKRHIAQVGQGAKVRRQRSCQPVAAQIKLQPAAWAQNFSHCDEQRD